MAKQMEQQPEGNILDAVQSGDIATVKKFLDEGVPVDLADEEGWSLLHHAAALGQVEVINLLHEKGCHVDMLDNEGRTPLHYAATNGDIETIRLLIAMGSNVNSVDNKGNTPLKWSVICEQNAAIEELTKFVVTADIEEMEPSDDNVHVITLGFPFQDPSHILGDGNNEVCHSSQTELTTNFHHVSTAVKSNDSYKHDHNSHQTDLVTTQQYMDTNADTAQLEGDIFEAAKCGNTATIKGYLDLGVPVDVTDEDGWSPVHHAIAHLQVEVIRLLMDRGCLMNPVKSKKYLLKEERVTQTSVATIFDAAQCGDSATVKGYLDLGVPVDVTDEDGWSPVHHAIAHCQVEVIRLLMDRGCLMNPVKNRKLTTKSSDLHITTEGGSKNSPYNKRQLYKDIFEAAQYGDTATVQSYLNSGGPVDLTDEDGRTLLHCAAGEGQIKVVELLIKRGCCIDPVDKNGWTPSIYATACGHVQTVQLIKQQLNEQYFTDSVDNQDRSVLHFASRHGQIRMIEMLAKKGLDVNNIIGYDHGWTPLHYAAAYGQLESVRTLLRLGGRKSMTKVAGAGGTPLHQAIAKGYKNIVSLLLKKGCPINVVDSKGRSVLHCAARYGQIHMIERLAEQGLDVNIGDDEGLTPLHAAAACSQLESVHTLLRLAGRKSMTKVVGTHGTPLHQAVERGHKDIVSSLLNEGCPINVVNSKGKSVLHYAAQAGQIHMMEMLAEQGLNVNIGDDKGRTPLHYAAACGQLESVLTLLRLGGRESMTKVAGTCGTPLHQAVVKGHKDTVSLLLNEGCPINIVDGGGSSVLHIAAESGQIHMIELLVEQGLDVNIGDDEGLNPLYAAAACGQLESVLTLFRLGGRESMTKVVGTHGAPLHQAVGKGHKDIVSLLLNEGCPINVVNSKGRSVLHFAAECGQIHMLAEQGLNVNIGDDKGRTPLHYAAACGQLESVLTLLRLGGRESMTKVAGTCGTPLHQAVGKGHKDIVSLLLNEGCPSNVVDGGGSNVLHIAAESGQIHLIELLAEQGLDVNIGNDVGMTPLHAAAACGQTKALHTLLKLGGRKSVTKIVGNAGTPLHQAVGKGHKDIVSLLLNEGCPISIVGSALHCAAQFGQIDVIEMLAERGLDVNIGENDGWTPLHDAATLGQLESVRTLLRLGGRESMTKIAGSHGTPLHQAVEKGHKDIVSLLLDEGCPITVVDSRDRSVLHYAAQVGQIHVIEMLAQQRLDVNIDDDEGWTPLHYAAVCGQLESVLTLLRLGGRESMTKVADIYGTPLHLAVAIGHKDIVSLLLNEGCPINVVNSEGRSVLHYAAQYGQIHMIKMFSEQGLDVNKGDNVGMTPLHDAAACGQLESVLTLLRLGGRESMTKIAGTCGTPLHQAVGKGHKDIVSLLLNEGCPINAVNSVGKSVLHFAAHGCQIDMIEMLAEQGLDVNIGDDEGLTPLHYAAERGHITTFNELVSIGGNVHHMDNFGMKCSDYILIRQDFVTLIQFCVACGLEYDDEDLLGVISALSAKSLLDMNRILCLAAVRGDISLFDAMVTSQYPLNQQKMPKMAICLSSFSGGKKLPDQFHVSEEPLNPLHISILSEYFSISWSIKFIEKLTSHPRTQYTVNELFPNGLSPLDVARRFELHDIAVIIERAGGGPGAWANLPKEIEDKAIDLYMSLKRAEGKGMR